MREKYKSKLKTNIKYNINTYESQTFHYAILPTINANIILIKCRVIFLSQILKGFWILKILSISYSLLNMILFLR